VRLFTLPGWPGQVQGHSAAVPHLNRAAGSGAQQYKDGVTGQPGTMAVQTKALSSATVPGGGAETPAPAGAMMGLGRSIDAPEAFYPNLYFARPQAQFWPGAGMPVSVRSDSLMPVPAADPRGVPAPLQVAIQPWARGQSQIAAIPVLASWPNVTG
jgi:hypothetical protein